MSDASNEAAGCYGEVDETICSECGEKLDKEAREAGRDVCFDCYCALQGGSE